MVVQLLVGECSLSPKARLYRRNFIRLVDKAVREYRKAREVLLAEVAEHGRHLRSYEFTDHIETCINAASRLFKLLEGIRSEKEALNFPRELRKLAETHSKSVRDIRNTVEHMDERIQKDAIALGKPIMLACSQEGDRIPVSDCELDFTDLAMVLGKTHEIAQYILTIRKQKPKEQ